MNVLSSKILRAINSKPTALYLIELRSRFSGTQARRQKLTPPVDSEPAGAAVSPRAKAEPSRKTSG